MKKFCFTILWALFALLLAGFLSGVTNFILAFAGVDMAKSSVTSLVTLSFASALFVSALLLGIFGKLPGTRQSRIE